MELPDNGAPLPDATTLIHRLQIQFESSDSRVAQYTADGISVAFVLAALAFVYAQVVNAAIGSAIGAVILFVLSFLFQELREVSVNFKNKRFPKKKPETRTVFLCSVGFALFAAVSLSFFIGKLHPLGIGATQVPGDLGKPDRLLKEYQKTQLSSCIEKNTAELSGMFIGSSTNPESWQFATDIIKVIKEKTSLKLSNQYPNSPDMEIWGSAYHGSYVSVKDVNNPPAGAIILLKCLENAKIDADYSQLDEGSRPSGAFGLSIAPK